jgi:hypothetical protein
MIVDFDQVMQFNDPGDVGIPWLLRVHPSSTTTRRACARNPAGVGRQPVDEGGTVRSWAWRLCVHGDHYSRSEDGGLAVFLSPHLSVLIALSYL